MAVISSIVVNFQDDQNTQRQVTVVPGVGPTQAIFLDGKEKQLLKNFNTTKHRALADAPTGSLKGDIEAATTSQLGVCYLIGGQLHCWEN